jgi:hypothetical protein
MKDYDAWMDATIGAALALNPRSIVDIVAKAQGADPLAVMERVRKIAGQTSLTLGDSFYYNDSGLGEDGPVDSGAPVPHPLDYEWRFSRDGVRAVLSTARRLGGGRLVTLGASTIAMEASRQSWAGGITDIGQSAMLTRVVEGRGVRSVEVDLMNDVIEVPGDVIVADPPWYPEYVHAFLFAAANMCVVGGHVILVLPGIGTRPGIDDERRDIASACVDYGLDVVEQVNQCIRYESPFFERNAFKAAGLVGAWGYWRSGDLWVLRRKEACSARRSKGLAADTWREFTVGRMRVRCRGSASQERMSCEVDLKQILDGDILPTVSRRDSRRSGVAVWTSGNRVYGCKCPSMLVEIGRALSGGADVPKSVAAALGRGLTVPETEIVETATRTLLRLAEKEAQEEADFYGRGVI